MAEADLAREESEEAELLRSEERMRQEEGHLSEFVLLSRGVAADSILKSCLQI